MGGKFRVKVGRRRSIGGAASSAPERPSNQSTAAFFMIFKKRSSRFKTLFAWQNGCDYRQ
jgi:hypothetical protein